MGSINELEDSEIDSHFNNILKSTILGTKFASAYLGESGVIINVGSFAGILPMKNASIYSSLKSAINNFTRSSAKEFALRIFCRQMFSELVFEYLYENIPRHKFGDQI